MTSMAFCRRCLQLYCPLYALMWFLLQTENQPITWQSWASKCESLQTDDLLGFSHSLETKCGDVAADMLNL